ncbi:MAG: molybdenum cofactor guanylyltransferase [Miltoncostaeaceae bacterium]|jgi:molybdopterin-guanine dinucleotide biosynthesis protein A|nr:molybdenum cofactor guanylyltransferase [Miltoncostaeaceae bacterium]
MGRPKASLEWHGSTLLRRVTGLVGRVAGPVVVVRAPGQPLPDLPPEARVVQDAREGRGPLQGLLAGLEALEDEVEAAFVAAVDAPLLHPAFVARVLAGLDGGAEAAVPRAGGRGHPLTAAYRTAVVPRVRERLSSDRLSARGLLDDLRVAWLDEEALLADARLAAADPALTSLRNLNGPEDYAAARALPAPAVRVRRRGAGAGPGADVRAATLGAATEAAGLPLGPAGAVVVGIGGGGPSRDPEFPLADGDVVVVSGAGLTGAAGGPAAPP